MSNGPRHNRRRADHSRLYVARVRRAVVAGELVTVSLELLRDGDVAELADGDEFVTLYLSVDPFAAPPSSGE